MTRRDMTRRYMTHRYMTRRYMTRRYMTGIPPGAATRRLPQGCGAPM